MKAFQRATTPLLLGTILVACQAQTVPNTQSQNSTRISTETVLKAASLNSLPKIPPKLAPSAKIRIEPEKHNPALAKLTFTITMPSIKIDDEFRTQAIAANNINWIKLEIAGVGIASPLWADGANGSGLVANAGGTFSVTVSNVPYGKARLATLSCYDSGQSAITGAIVKSAFEVSSASTNVELSYKTTPTAETVENITGSTANQYLAGSIDLTALQSFVNTLTGASGTAPNYTYTTHPTLIVGSAIATDLIANSGNIAGLNASNPAYKITPGTVNFTLAGLIGPDTATVNLRDPASGAVINLANGASSVTGVKPGTWILEATASGYTASSSPSVVVTAGGTANAGTITFSVAAAPAISSLSASSGIIGSSIQINGSNFHSTIAGNTVDFSGTVATVTAASSTQLTVTVPAGISGSQNVRVTVGGQASNTNAFAVTPNISSLSTSSGIIGSSLQINGSGFDTTPGNNTVKLGTTNATVTAASNTQLTVTVPSAPTGNFTAQVGSQTSNGSAFNVLPTIELVSPLDNAVVYGNSVIVASGSTSGNTISKVEYFIDATEIGESSTPGYSINWDTTSATSGTYVMTAKITDSEGNTATSAGIDITINQLPVISSVTSSLSPIPGLSHPTLMTCNATDSDSTLTSTSYNWSTVGGTFGSFSATTGSQVYWTAPSSAGGPYTIRCTVNDGINDPVTQDLSVSVTSGNGTVNGSGGLF